jgi:tripartite-type tricarboxylate transporter receptor subunit TctC
MNYKVFFKEPNAIETMNKLLLLIHTSVIFSLGLFLQSSFAVDVVGNTYPSRPVKIIVPYGPGGGSDIIIRAMQNKLAETLGQSIVIENKPGASTILGTDFVAKSAPDGYTAMIVDMAFLVNPSLFAKLPYDSQKDLIPVIELVSTPSIMLASSKMPFKNLKEFIQLAKSSPNKLSYASAGFGTGGHMASEMLKVVTGIDLVHVPYKGAGPAMTDTLGAHVSIVFTTVGAAKPYVESGQIIGLGITSEKRVEALPQVPTFAEQGYPEVNANIVWGIFLPVGVPKEIVQKINVAFNATTQSPEIKQRLNELGFTLVGGTSDHWSDEVRKLTNNWSKIVKQANIQPAQ